MRRITDFVWRIWLTLEERYILLEFEASMPKAIQP